MKYFLISLYPVNPNRWVVYGHIQLGWSEFLGEYKTKQEAYEKAFQFSLPVMVGQGAIIDSVLEKLSKPEL